MLGCSKPSVYTIPDGYTLREGRKMISVADAKSLPNPNDCSCEECKSACERKPGWLKPGQAEVVASHLNISLEELFQTKLMVDFWEHLEEFNNKDAFVLSPAVVGGNPGEVPVQSPRNLCLLPGWPVLNPCCQAFRVPGSPSHLGW